MRKTRNSRRDWRKDAAMTEVPYPGNSTWPLPRPNRAQRRLWGWR